MSRKDLSTLDTASCCHPERCDPGSHSSGSLGGGRSPAINFLPDGGSKAITLVSPLTLSTTSLRHDVAGSPSSSRTSSPATAGCRCQIIERESAQLAQKAALLIRVADLNPMPPSTKGSEPVSRAPASHCSGGRLRISHRQCHKLLSCLAAKGADNDG